MEQQIPESLLPMMEYLRNIPEPVLREIWELQAKCLAIEDPEELAIAQRNIEQHLAQMIATYGQPPCVTDSK